MVAVGGAGGSGSLPGEGPEKGEAVAGGRGWLSRGREELQPPPAGAAGPGLRGEELWM